MSDNAGWIVSLKDDITGCDQKTKQLERAMRWYAEVPIICEVLRAGVRRLDRTKRRLEKQLAEAEART